MRCPLTFSLAIATALLSAIGRRVRISGWLGGGQGKQHDGRSEGGAGGFHPDILESWGVKEVPVGRTVAGRQVSPRQLFVFPTRLLARLFVLGVGGRGLFLGLGSAVVGSD